jgi:hypothetical protein
VLYSAERDATCGPAVPLETFDKPTGPVGVVDAVPESRDVAADLATALYDGAMRTLGG